MRTAEQQLHSTLPRHQSHRDGGLTRRLGYTVALVVDVVLLELVNGAPGWEAVPFLTSDFTEVVGLVNASIVLGVVANAVYLAHDPRWLRGLGDLATTAVGLWALVALWQVFPFAFSVDWVVDPVLLTRWVLAVGIVGSGIGLVSAFVRFVGGLVAARSA